LPIPHELIFAFLEDPARAADLPRWVLDYARGQEMFAPGDRVLAAVSGGPDSVALLHLLARLGPELGLSLGVGHFDHGLRVESREDAAFVAELAGTLSLPCHLGQGEVRDLARREKISLQMAGRRLRLAFLRETCRTRGYHKLALGHTADDQIELFWLRLLRGAALTGLKGMEPVAAAGLVRPLLAVGKEVLLAWLARESLSFRRDASNLSRAYLRNRVRLDLLPQLIRDYQPRLKQTVWRTMALLNEEDRLLAREAARAWAAAGREVAPGLVALKLPVLLGLDKGQQKRLLQTAAGQIAPHHTLTASQVAALLDLARGARSGGLLKLGRELQAARAGAELHFLEPLPEPLAGATPIPREAAEPESPPGWRWRLTRRPAGGPEEFCPAPHAALMDLERLPFPLEVRGCRPGDRFWPQGGPGLRKLQDFLVDAKIPRWLRPHLPLLAKDGQVLWVPGLRVAEPLKITPETRRLLEVEVHPTTPATRRLWEILRAWRL
jgi:tRNA(Ile)-lysidine synthase